MNRTIDKLRMWLSVDLTLAEEIRSGSHGLDDDEDRLARALLDDPDGTSSYTDAEATHAVNILKKLLGTSESADEFYDRARGQAIAGTGNLLPIPVGEDLFDTLLKELNDRDHHKGQLSIAAFLDWRNEMLLVGTWNGLGHYGIKRDVEELGVDSELIKLSVEHAEGADEVLITYFDRLAVGPFKPFRWFAGSREENAFVLSKPGHVRAEARLILAHHKGLGMHAIGFLSTLIREFPDTKILLCAKEAEVEVAASVISLMMMPLKMGDEVRIVAAGPDADAVIERIEGFASSGGAFLKANKVSATIKPPRNKSVDVIVNEGQGVHFRVIGGLLGLVRACDGTKLYLTMDGVDRMDVSPRSFSRLCSLGVSEGSRITLCAEGPEAVTLIEKILYFKLNDESPVFLPCRLGGKKGPSGGDDPEGGTTPPSGGRAPTGGEAPSSSFRGISRSSSDAKATDCASHEMAAAETLQQKSFGPTIYDPIVLGAATFAASTARAI